jgi:D-amino-acid dehydrogenase
VASVKVVIIGAGLIGLTAAYFLRKRGYDVTVIDRQTGPGLETSFANGSLLTPSMPEPWNAPGCWRVLLSSLGRSDAPLQLRLRALPSLSGWGVQFLRNSNVERYRENTVRNIRLALHSLKVMASIREETQLDYGATLRGTLRLFRSPVALNAALTEAERLLRPEGLRFHGLSREEIIALQPALEPIAGELVGAIHYPVDETGDAYRFCVVLGEHARKIGVEFAFSTTVPALETIREGKRIKLSSHSREGLSTPIKVSSLEADHYVVACGSYSTELLRPLGIHLPVRPAKGYSVTFDAPIGTSVLKVPIVDDDMHAALVSLGNCIRVAGTAEFAGFDLTLRPERVRNVASLAQRILPRAGLDLTTARPWCGLRPMSADGVPIIGRTPIENLWVSTGHGPLGWTMAAGSGQILSELMSGDALSLDPAPYALTRFRRM